MSKAPFRRQGPLVGSNPADRYTTIEDTLGTNLTAMGFTVYKRKGAVIRESDTFPCVIIAPSDDGEEVGIEALGGITEYMYPFRVYYVQEYARNLNYEDVGTRYTIRKEIYRILQFPSTISPTRVLIKGIQPFSINGNPNTVYTVTGFRVTYGFMEQGLV